MDEPDVETPMIVPLSINCVMSYFPCQKPTCSESEDGDVRRIDFTGEALDWDPLDRDFSEREGEMKDFRGELFEEEAMERLPKIVISEVSLGTAGINLSSNDNVGLMLESNANMSHDFTTASMTNLETHNIMRVGTSSSRSLSTINHEMVQSRWGINPALAKNMV